MRVWLKLKLTPKGDFCVVSVRAFFVNFFMHSSKRYLKGQIKSPRDIELPSCSISRLQIRYTQKIEIFVSAHTLKKLTT